MSASVYWRPTASRKYLKEVGSANLFKESMIKAFGYFPDTLTEQHIPTLVGMAAATTGDNPYQKLIELVEKHEEINLEFIY